MWLGLDNGKGGYNAGTRDVFFGNLATGAVEVFCNHLL